MGIWSQDISAWCWHSLIFRRIQNMLNDSATRTPGTFVLLAHDQSFRRDEDVQLLQAVLTHFKNDPIMNWDLSVSIPVFDKNTETSELGELHKGITL